MKTVFRFYRIISLFTCDYVPYYTEFISRAALLLQFNKSKRDMTLIRSVFGFKSKSKDLNSNETKFEVIDDLVNKYKGGNLLIVNSQNPVDLLANLQTCTLIFITSS